MARINTTPQVVQACLCPLRSMLQVPPRVPPNMYNNDFTLPARCTVPSAASLAAFNVAKALFKTEGERTTQRKIEKKNNRTKEKMVNKLKFKKKKKKVSTIKNCETIFSPKKNPKH